MSPLPSRVGTWAAAHRFDLAAVFIDKRGLLFHALYINDAAAIGDTIGVEPVAIGCDIDPEAAHKSLKPLQRIALRTWRYNHARW